MHRIQQNEVTLEHGKKDRSARLNTLQKAKKWLPGGSQKKHSGLGSCISLVKDNLSIDQIFVGIKPDDTIFFTRLYVVSNILCDKPDCSYTASSEVC